jgi:hypothetical protein
VPVRRVLGDKIAFIRSTLPQRSTHAVVGMDVSAVGVTNSQRANIFCDEDLARDKDGNSECVRRDEDYSRR